MFLAGSFLLSALRLKHVISFPLTHEVSSEQTTDSLVRDLLYVTNLSLAAFRTLFVFHFGQFVHHVSQCRRL
jgi:hypothetical protein